MQITTTGASNFVIGIESQDTNHAFKNSTGGYFIWHYPTSANGFQIFSGSMTNADNNTRGWYSNWFPLQNGNNAIGFYNQ